MTSEEYKAAVLQAKEHILAGDIFQIVFSQRFECRTFADPFEFYRALRVVNPSPSMTYLQVHYARMNLFPIICAMAFQDMSHVMGKNREELLAMTRGHGDVKKGSLGNSLNEVGVQNVMVTNIMFTKTQNGVRIKSWTRDTKSYATNLEFRNIIMRAVNNPIIIYQTYCRSNQCPCQTSGVEVSNVRYNNIKGTSTTVEAVKFQCSVSNPCRGIRNSGCITSDCQLQIKQPLCPAKMPLAPLLA